MYWTHSARLVRKAPAGIRLTIATMLLISGEMRSGVCGNLGSGGWAFNTAALAMPTASAPNARAFCLTCPEVSAIRSPRIDYNDAVNGDAVSCCDRRSVLFIRELRCPLPWPAGFAVRAGSIGFPG